MQYIKILLLFSSLFMGNEENLKKDIEKILPPGLQINFVEPSPIPNFYVVNVANNQILYVSKNFEFVLAGEVIQLDEGKISSLNDLYETKLIKNILATIDNSESIDFISDKEKFRLKIFTDVSCSYCRLLHSEIETYLSEGISITYLAFPRDGLNGKVFNDMVSAWCNANPKAALTKLKKGEDIKQNKCDSPVEEHFRKGSLLGITGTPTIILEDGRKFSGYIPAKELIKIIENG